MIVLIVAIVVLGIVVAVAAKIGGGKADDDQPIKEKGGCNTCTGNDPRCEQVCMMEAATKEIEYYDDEQLDRYRGRRSDQYSDQEAEEFREVLYTMRQDEAKGWSRSLTLRGIEVPNQIKDELLMMVESN